ncbi:30S ribosomal protein S15 [archaeon]|nr:30S ribosomal protein S15 [archaeon]
MARMYSRRKGKAGSKKPIEKKLPSWLAYPPKEVEQLVLKLAKAEKTAAEIGTILRDTYGIPSVSTITSKKITRIFEENKLKAKLPQDLASLLKQVIILLKHREQHKKDNTSLRGLQLTESKIKRLIKYYKKTKQLPQDWAYEREKVKLLLE